MLPHLIVVVVGEAGAGDALDEESVAGRNSRSLLDQEVEHERVVRQPQPIPQHTHCTDHRHNVDVELAIG